MFFFFNQDNCSRKLTEKTIEVIGYSTHKYTHINKSTYTHGAQKQQNMPKYELPIQWS